MTDDPLFYACTNEACEMYDEVVIVGPGESAECDECGWFMEASLEAPDDGE